MVTNRAGSAVGLDRLLDSPQFNYEPFNSNSVNIRSWSWNYRGCSAVLGYLVQEV